MTDQTQPNIAKPAPADRKPKEPKAQPEPKSPRQSFGMQSVDFLLTLQDMPVQVTTLDGKQYTAVLVGVDQFNILLRLKNGMIAMMPKHAIKLLRAAPDKPASNADRSSA